MTFTIGRGNELCVAAVEALKPLLVGKTLESFTSDMGAFWRMITGDSQLRWVGPEKGVIHLATAAVVNAVWDLWAKAQGKPVWRLLCDMTPEEIVRCIDFRYITDALTPEEALAILRANVATRSARVAEMERDGYPRLHDVGWLVGLYAMNSSERLCRDAIAEGWTHFKIKVGGGYGRRYSALHDYSGGDRRSQADDGCESAMGCRRGHREHAEAGAFRSMVDRGADQSG